MCELFSGSLTDVGNIYVGHSTDRERKTGVTAILAPRGAVCGVDVRGAAPGTRETDLLKPGNLVGKVHGVMLCGGSAFGLNAVAGAMALLESNNIGFEAGPFHVPIIPAAVLFDLSPEQGRNHPGADMGALAFSAALASMEFQNSDIQGRVGAGTGATIGKIIPGAIPAHGGIGTASIKFDGYTIAALVAVNALGDVYNPHTGELISSGTIEGRAATLDISGDTIQNPWTAQIPAEGTNTTIGVAATDAPLTKEQASRMASVAHDGLARSIKPVHTQMDGDTLFAMSSGEGEAALPPHYFSIICAAAAEVVARAVANAAVCAKEIAHV